MAGGPLNDLTKVGGDLTLDGTIDVTVSPGGSFDAGLYRVISYGGALNDQGLALGTMPAGSVVGVQTSVANQVNLINSAGATVNFWDGGALANKLDGQVNGGDGVWQNSTGNDNWADIERRVQQQLPGRFVRDLRRRARHGHGRCQSRRGQRIGHAVRQ